MGRLIGVLVTAVVLVGLALSVPVTRADWSGDGHADVLAIDPGERLLLSGFGTRPSRAAS